MPGWAEEKGQGQRERGEVGRGENQGSQSQSPQFVTEQPQVSVLGSRSLSFPLYKMGAPALPASKGFSEAQCVT